MRLRARQPGPRRRWRGLSVIGGITFRISSGGSKIVNGTLGLYLTDQPDGCMAISQVPVGMSTVLTVLVSPAGDGTIVATLVPNLIQPDPGQGIAELAAQVGQTVTTRYLDSDGSISWTGNLDGSTTIDTLDLGFSGTSDRLVLSALTVPACD